jgi:hypothetical protein
MDARPSVPPPASVLAAWDVSDAQPLAGGQGEAYRAGALVLKTTEPAQAAWLAGVVDTLAPVAGLRVAAPARSTAGAWVVDGWTAWHWVDGSHRHRAWDEVLEVSARFHQAAAGVSWSPSMAASHRWAVADRVAWGEVDAYQPLIALLDA